MTHASNMHNRPIEIIVVFPQGDTATIPFDTLVTAFSKGVGGVIAIDPSTGKQIQADPRIMAEHVLHDMLTTALEGHDQLEYTPEEIAAESEAGG